MTWHSSCVHRITGHQYHQEFIWCIWYQLSRYIWLIFSPVYPIRISNWKAHGLKFLFSCQSDQYRNRVSDAPIHSASTQPQWKQIMPQDKSRTFFLSDLDQSKIWRKFNSKVVINRKHSLLVTNQYTQSVHPCRDETF